jgi:uncharacterized protein
LCLARRNPDLPYNENILTKLTVKITSNAPRNQISGVVNGILRIKIAAPPDKGKANEEMVDFLSKNLRIRKNEIQILRGHTSRNKLIGIVGLDIDTITSRLLADHG